MIARLLSSSFFSSLHHITMSSNMLTVDLKITLDTVRHPHPKCSKK